MRSALLLLLVGCSNSFPSSDVVVDLRIVSLVAEPPEAPPGSSSTLTAYFANPTHASTPIDVRIGRCPVRGDTDGTFDCAPADELTLASGPALATTSSQSVFSFSFVYTVPSDIFDGHSALAQRCGYNEVLLVHGDDGLHPIGGLKRIVVKPDNPYANHNPTMGGPGIAAPSGGFLLFDAVAPSGAVSAVTIGHEYGAVPGSYGLGEPESFDLCRFDGTPDVTQEELIFSWQCSIGCTLANDTSYNTMQTGLQSIRLTPTVTPTGAAPFTMYLVLRDGRGGEAFSAIDFPFAR